MQLRELFSVFTRGRSFCTALAALPEELQKWSSHQWISPPVAFVAGQSQPTTLSWLRRRGPEISQGIIFKLFRQHKIRFFDGERIRHAKKNRVLGFGDRILLPNRAIKDHQTYAAKAKPLTKEQRKAKNKDAKTERRIQALIERSKDWILYSCDDFFVINKPERIPVQGGKGIRISIDSLYDRIAQEEEWTESPKLVHRLDKMTTGALILARDSNAASWLCQAFHDQQSKTPVTESQRLSIEKTYWAILDARAMAQQKGKIQTLFTEGSTKQPTETYFETLALKQDLAFVKLRPKTGRKHQLRLHCSFKLNAPILGDRIYDHIKKQKQMEFRVRYKDQLGFPVLDHFYLHARELIIKQPGKKPIKIIAPVPLHMQKLIHCIQTEKLSDSS